MLLRAGMDLYHDDLAPHSAFAAAKDRGVLFCLHKITQGLTAKDPLWRDRFQAAQAVGMYTGGYHFLTNASGSDQAKYFLDEFQPSANAVVMLDHETYKPSQGTLQQARDFLTTVANETSGRRYPLYYSFKSFLLSGAPPWGVLQDENGVEFRDEVLANSFLAFAEYGVRDPKGWPTKTWPDWFLWQLQGTETEGGERLGFPNVVDAYNFNGVPEDLDAFFQGKASC